MPKRVVIGTRGSKLALTQAALVMAAINQRYPDLEVTVEKIVTVGDKNRRANLNTFSQQGVFVRELEEALLRGEIDMAVHSLKDVPTEIPAGLSLTSVLPRANPSDVLVSRGRHLHELPPGARVGTSSLRRKVQLKQLRSDVSIVDLRGNVDTRLHKVFEEELDAVILAAAGIERLGERQYITEYLPIEHFVPAVGQGAIVVETRSVDEASQKISGSFNHLDTWQCVIAERAFLHALGGGCRAPIAALGSIEGAVLKLIGMVADPEGKTVIKGHEAGDINSPADIGLALARLMREKGAGPLISEAGK